MNLFFPSPGHRCVLEHGTVRTPTLAASARPDAPDDGGVTESAPHEERRSDPPPPSTPPPDASDVGLEDLEWPRLQEAVLAHCRGPRARGGRIPLPSDRRSVQAALAESREAMRLRQQGEPLPLDVLPETAPLLARLQRGGDLDGPELRDVQRMLETSRALRRFLRRRRDRCPALWAACRTDPSLDELTDLLGEHLESDGRLSDRASPTLRSLRAEVSALRQRIVGRLESILQRQSELFQDRFYTQRDGRYVVPLRADTPRRFPGIVHGTSGSGATLFVEPQPLVPLGNALKVAEGRLRREEARILAALCDRLRDRLTSLQHAAEALDHADLRDAMARFGERTGGRVLDLTDDPLLELREARHPLLLQEAEGPERVVANDLILRAGEVWVLSGPNAGGKTVVLKTLGLAALSARAGIPFPCAEGSRIGLMAPVLADVGDHQSTERNLSTFSAHARRVASVLREARHGTLVLLDELAASTDPHEGAALARAVLERLAELGAAVAVTTHYEELKVAAELASSWRNASVGFDLQSMKPTFRLHDGIPGASAALRVAARFGIPTEVIQRAAAIRPHESGRIEEVARRLQERAVRIEAERAELREQHRDLGALRQDLERQRQSLERREREALSEKARKIRRRLAEVEHTLADARAALREEKPSAKAIARFETALRRARTHLEEAEALPSPEEVSAPVSPEVGRTVWVERLRAHARIQHVDPHGRVQVVAGAMRLWVDATELRDVRTRSEASPLHGRHRDTEAARHTPAAAERCVDLRGRRVEDALREACREVDLGLAEGAPRIVLRHGVGTGALREALRRQLPDHLPYAVRIRPGYRDEGGDEVTVVELS